MINFCNKHVKVGLTVAIFTIVSLSIVFSVQALTSYAIAQAKFEAQNARFAKLLPKGSYDNNPAEECYLVPNLGANLKEVYIARLNGNITGYVVNYDVIGGYATPFSMVAGVDANGKITYVDIVEFNETPGLGDKILRTKSSFLDSFTGVSTNTRKFDIKKYGGDFDSFTGASVTPRAVVRSTHVMLQKIHDMQLNNLAKCVTEAK